MKSIIIGLFALVLFACSENTTRQDMPLRYAKVFSEKYKNSNHLSVFVAMANQPTWKNEEYFTDKWLYDNFESKGKKYILISFVQFAPMRSIFEYLVVEEKTSIALHHNTISIYESSEEMFMDSSKLAYMATKDEVMVDVGDLMKSYQGLLTEPSMVTYFDGKKQRTAYFYQPEYAVAPEDEFRTLNESEKMQKNAALYVVYMWKYCFLGLVRRGAWIEDDKELYEKIEDDMQKALKEIPDKLVE